MKKLVLLALLALRLAATPNFAYVQKTPATGALSQSFPSNTTAGGIIVAMVYGSSSGNTVSDTQGNTYTAIAIGTGGSPLVSIFIALNIIGGADTVTTAAGSGSTPGGLIAAEYSSANSTYYACRAATGNPNPGSGLIANSTLGYTTFHSNSEVMVVWDADANSSLATYTATTGTVRYTGTMPYNFTTGVGFGDDDVSPNMTGSYSNNIKLAGSNFASQSVAAVFLNLDNPGCITSPGGATPGTFTIIY